MKRTFIYLIIIASLATSCGNSKEFDATGNFESTEIIVSSEVIGKLITLNVNEGDLVKQDSVIGYVDSTQLFFQKERIIKSIDAVGAKMSDIPLQTAAIKQQIKNLEIERQRAENLVNKSERYLLKKDILTKDKITDWRNYSVLTADDADPGDHYFIADVENIFEQTKLQQPQMPWM